jgi:phosphate ABC transporter phosphate-binding protein
MMTAALTGGTLLAASAVAVGETKGSGATFPRIAYQTWCQDSGGLCSYTAKGSTGGINDFIAGNVDFGASDAPLTDAQFAELKAKRGGSGVYYFPTLLGAVTIPTNISGQPGPLQLRSKTVAEIFAGVVTKWNDPKIVADNKTNPRTRNFRFPDVPITTCVRQDGSGTSFVTSTYMAKSSADFRTRVGVGQSPNWSAPTIIRAPGNAGVANCVRSNQNAIGYVDLADARASGLGNNLAAVGKSEVIRVKKRIRGKLRNVTIRRLVYVYPSVPGIQRAGNIDPEQVPRNLVLDLTLSKAKAAYPIVSTTWVLAYDNFAAAGKSGSLAGVKSTLNYFYSSAAQGKLESMGFAPLPPVLLNVAKTQMNKLR